MRIDRSTFFVDLSGSGTGLSSGIEILLSSPFLS
jgi:hypothetical protein